MTVTLETLELTPEEHQTCQEAVRKQAYFNWIDAGRPVDRDLEFWLAAEREWIGHNYVPHRGPIDDQSDVAQSTAIETVPQHLTKARRRCRA